MFHQWIALTIFFLLALAGLGLTIVGIGGTMLILIGALLYDLITWSLTISSNTLVWVAGLAILGELLEWIITWIGIKKAGVSKYGLVGVVLGAIIGGFLLSIIPILGTIAGVIIGSLVGAFIGEFYETRNMKKAWKAAKAVFLGRAVVSLCKVLIAVIQIWLIIKEIF